MVEILVRVNDTYPYPDIYPSVGLIIGWDSGFYTVVFTDGKDGLFTPEELSLV